MKKLLIGLMLLTTFSGTFAQTVQNTDGLNTQISIEELASLEDWVNNTKKELEFISRFVTDDRGLDQATSVYETEIARIVGDNTKINALGMRKYLNRAVEINTIVKSGTKRKSSKKFRLQMFKVMVEAAEASYSSDIDFINGNKESEGTALLQMRRTLLSLYKTSQTKDKNVKSRVQIKMLKKIAGFINRDFFDSSFAQVNAFEINKVNTLVTKNSFDQSDVNTTLSLVKSLSVASVVASREVVVDIAPRPVISGANVAPSRSTGRSDHSRGGVAVSESIRVSSDGIHTIFGPAISNGQVTLPIYSGVKGVCHLFGFDNYLVNSAKDDESSVLVSAVLNDNGTFFKQHHNGNPYRKVSCYNNLNVNNLSPVGEVLALSGGVFKILFPSLSNGEVTVPIYSGGKGVCRAFGYDHYFEDSSEDMRETALFSINLNDDGTFASEHLSGNPYKSVSCYNSFL